jgi:hypothetical protein
MTRINVVPVQELCNKHLFAEWRELPRIINHINKNNGKVNLKNVPPYYILGTGHVRFFYNKLRFLVNRHQKLTEELVNRGYNIKPQGFVLDLSNPDINYLYNDWEPGQLDLKLNRERIRDRMPENPKFGGVNNGKN